MYVLNPRAALALVRCPLAVAILLGVGLLQARRAPAEPPTFECRFTSGEFKIDGVADEEAWKNSQVIDRFVLGWLKDDKARPPRTATRARLLWDRENLYFFAEMEDGDLYADVTEQDGQTWDNDVFELFFKPADDKPGYYELQVNAAGTRMDTFIPRRGSGGFPRYKKTDDFRWETKVALRGTLNKYEDKDEGWSVEGRIPWRDLKRTGGRPEPGESWKMALCRYDYSVDFEGPDLSSCAPLDSLGYPDFHHFEDYAKLLFVGPKGPAAPGAAKGAGTDKPPRGIERVNLIEPLVVGSPDPPLPYRSKRVYPDVSPSLPISVVRQPRSDQLWIVTLGSAVGPATIYRMTDRPDVKEMESLLQLPEIMAYDVCFHPKFAENGYVYVGLNGPGTEDPKVKTTRVVRYRCQTASPFALDPQSASVIIEWPSDGHNGAGMCFGHDGMFYVTSGDGTSDSDTHVVGQEMTKLTSKVLRIDLDHPDPGKSYSVPQDNPFLKLEGARPETWAFGLRNPWRMTVDVEKGHIWVGNNGQDLWEQAFFVRKGDNYGWSVMEGSHEFYPNRQVGPTPPVKPTLEHPHSEARSLTGGVVYYGQRYPELRGAYIYGDFSTGKIWAAKHDGEKVVWHKEIADTSLAISGFAADSQGELIVVDHRPAGQSGFYTLEPTPAEAVAKVRFPRRLSESRLFKSLARHELIDGAIPYSVNSPLWSDGAYKERYLLLFGENPRIDFTRNRAWTLPDQSLLVKSFALEMVEGDPTSRRWIETRLLTKQQGEWVGYSYLWNPEQTDAALVEAAGAEREYAIRVRQSEQFPDGVRRQKWHYPSRAECMVCHSRAANYILGLTELQFNREHDYHGVKENQLALLERMGYLRISTADAVAAIKERGKAAGRPDDQVNDESSWLTTTTRDQRVAGASSLLPVPPAAMRKMPDPYDPSAALAERAKSYLHANCSHCHVEAGGGNAAMELEYSTLADKMRVIDVAPLHHKFDLPDARIVAPGAPDRSTLLRRVSRRERGQMPPLASGIVDERAVEMLRAWIGALGSGKE